jgi:hypothetical protein
VPPRSGTGAAGFLTRSRGDTQPCDVTSKPQFQGWSSFPMRSYPSRYVSASNSTRVMREDEAVVPRP